MCESWEAITVVDVEEVAATLAAPRVDDVPCITAVVDLLPEVNCRQVMEISTVAVASHRVASTLRSRIVAVAQWPWRLLYFMIAAPTCGLLSKLTVPAALVVLVALAVVVP
jgi:hypothetical protein